MQGLVLGLMPVVMLVALYLISPDSIGVFLRSGRGLALLAFAAVWELIGALIIKRIITIDV